MSAQRKMTPWRARRMYTAHRAGMPIMAIARRLRIWPDTVRRAFLRYGLQGRGEAYQRPPNADEIDAADAAMRRKTEAIVARLKARDARRWNNP